MKKRNRNLFKAAQKSGGSNIIKSTRRIFFNHLDQSIVERGHFHVDTMYGSGTGILIKIKEIFFLLTARHVIENATKFRFQNESPFWVTSRSQYKVSSICDFLMPARIFHIGEKISTNCFNIDTSDLVAIELFSPFPNHQPDNFLDFNVKKSPLLTREEFFDGQYLYAAGYPFEKNGFQFLNEPREGMTHETTVQRHIATGMCKFENFAPYMSIEHLRDGEYPDLSGASGGAVTNIQPKANMVKLAGMMLSANKKLIRFLPSYLIQEGLEKICTADSVLIDPSAEKTANPEIIFALMSDYYKRNEHSASALKTAPIHTPQQ